MQQRLTGAQLQAHRLGESGYERATEVGEESGGGERLSGVSLRIHPSADLRTTQRARTDTRATARPPMR